MTGPIERLHQDHANFSNLLQVLERQLDRVETLEKEDPELMRDAMAYITRYSDRVHHPTEDLVYARLAEKSPQARDRLADVPRDHEALIVEGRELHETLMGIVDGEMVERDNLVTLGRSYIAHLRKHMRLEEEHLFPIAKSVLDKADLAEVERVLDAQRDPVFGPVVENDFRDLYEHIQREVAER